MRNQYPESLFVSKTSCRGVCENQTDSYFTIMKEDLKSIRGKLP